MLRDLVILVPQIMWRNYDVATFTAKQTNVEINSTYVNKPRKPLQHYGLQFLFYVTVYFSLISYLQE